MKILVINSDYDDHNFPDYTCTVKPAHAVTSIKQSPALKGHLFLVLSYKISSILR